jgi:hypothetical protein
MGTGIICAPAAAGSSAKAKKKRLPIRKNTLREVIENRFFVVLPKIQTPSPPEPRDPQCRGRSQRRGTEPAPLNEPVSSLQERERQQASAARTGCFA